jgi:hypothetical protein
VLRSASGSSSEFSASLMLNTPTAINAYLDGKTMVMAGADIPADPLGASQATSGACWTKLTMQIASPGDWNVTWNVATENGGTCNAAAPLGVTSQPGAVVIANVQGNATCFDINVTFPNMGVSGRGSISADGKTVSLEFYNVGEATGATCADGAVGAHTVTSTALPVNRVPFAAPAVTEWADGVDGVRHDQHHPSAMRAMRLRGGLKYGSPIW